MKHRDYITDDQGKVVTVLTYDAPPKPKTRKHKFVIEVRTIHNRQHARMSLLCMIAARMPDGTEMRPYHKPPPKRTR